MVALLYLISLSRLARVAAMKQHSYALHDNALGSIHDLCFHSITKNRPGEGADSCRSLVAKIHSREASLPACSAFISVQAADAYSLHKCCLH